MKMTYTQVLEAALTLGKNDRRKLRERLNENLDPLPKVVDESDDEARLMTGDMTEAEIGAELERRAEEMRLDPSTGIPWEKVLADTDRRLKNANRTASPRTKRVRQSV